MLRKLLCSLAFLLLISGMCVGCSGDEEPVQSLQPFYSEESVVELPGLDGSWHVFQSDGELQLSSRPWELANNNLTLTDLFGVADLEGIPAVFFAVDNTLFVDIYADGTLREGTMFFGDPMLFSRWTTGWWWMRQHLRTHAAYRVQVNADRSVITLQPLDRDWLIDQVHQDPLFTGDPIAYMLARTTSAWMSFLAKHRHNDAAFGSAIDHMILVRSDHRHVFEMDEDERPLTLYSPNPIDMPNGARSKAQSVVQYHDNGQSNVFVLDADWESPQGFTARGGNFIKFHEDGSVGGLVLDADWTCPQGFTIRGGTVLGFYESGYVSEATLATDWTSPKGELRKAGVRIELKDPKPTKPEADLVFPPTPKPPPPPPPTPDPRERM